MVRVYERRKPRQCKVCGKEFMPKRKTSKYCSQQCQHLGIRQRPLTSICLYCGKEFSLSRNRMGMYCSNRCQWDSMKLSDEVVKERKRQKEYSNAIKDLINTLDKIVDNIDSDINRISECNYCGNYYIKYKGSNYCSNDCKRKYNNRMIEERHKNRLKKNGKPDYSITLEKLYKRDKGICSLCGSKTNYNDYIVDDKGNFIVGYSYPSIDHIVPIAKGGVHQWYNVQLACHRCNTLKRDC